MRIDNLTQGELDSILRRLTALERATPLANASITRGGLRIASTEGLIVEGSQRISGLSSVTGSQTVSGTSTISGTETITGTEIINGSLEVNGSIQIDGAMTVNTPGALFNGEVIATGGLSVFSMPTTTSASNVRRNSLGEFQEVTSAARFKIDPQPMDLPVELLDIPVEWWIDRSDAESIADLHDAPRPLTRRQQALYDGATFERVPGVIAEKVLAAGGEAFVGYDEHGELHSVSYDRFALARTQVLADQLKAALVRIATLEARDATAP